MKKILYVIASFAILAGAYVWSFGVPSAILPETAETAQATGGTGGPGGPGGPEGQVVALEVARRPLC